MINEDNISKENGFTVPDSFLEKMYEFTGNGEEGGFILAYVNSEGRPMVNCKISSQIIEMGFIQHVRYRIDFIKYGNVRFVFGLNLHR